MLSRFYDEYIIMKIEEIKLVNFRNYEHVLLNPHEGINLFFGPNGSGKTNLLEAIHYCALGKSHRTVNDQNVVRAGEKTAYCSVTVCSRQIRKNISVNLFVNDSNKKSISIDNKKISRFSELMGCLQCVIFSPEDLGLIKEGPSFRRRYLDMMISQLNRKYFIALQQYKIGLDQRNALLKKIKMNQIKQYDYLEDFDQAIAGPAEIIIQERKKIENQLAVLASESYKTISGKDHEDFQLTYHSPMKESENIYESLLKQLADARDEDIRLGVTSVGPHRDDLILSLNKKNMKAFASQGQIRTGSLCMKLAQLKLLKEMSEEEPVLLLDDVMSELDLNRRMRLLDEIKNYQTFITCTDESDLEINRMHRVYQVKSNHDIGSLLETNKGYENNRPTLHEPDFT